MTTETTDPLEQAVMEAADDYGAACYADGDGDSRRISSEPPNAEPAEKRERLQLHVQLALAKARQQALRGAIVADHHDHGAMCYEAHKEIAALEARLQEE